jgi:hypothetical protein
MVNIIIIFVTALVAIFGGYAFRRYIAERKIQDAEAKAKYILE